MKLTSARAKGKQFERELAKLIEQRLGGRCWRTPMSGAHWYDKTDVNCTGNIFQRFHAEAKRQEKFSLETWYNQALHGAQGSKIPIVIARRSHDKAMVYMTLDDFLTVLEEWQTYKYACEELEKEYKP